MDELDIREVIDLDLIEVDLSARDKKEAISQLSLILEKGGYLKNREEFVKDVLLRETEGITGLGDGIAIPHGKSDGVKRTAVAIGKLENSIFWESLDNEPVSVIILFAVKKTDETTTHIKLLQEVAILLANEEFLISLKEAKSKDDIYSLIVPKKIISKGV